MKKKQIAGLVVAAALFVGVSAASVFTNTICKNMLQSSVKDVIDLAVHVSLIRRQEIILQLSE